MEKYLVSPVIITNCAGCSHEVTFTRNSAEWHKCKKTGTMIGRHDYEYSIPNWCPLPDTPPAAEYRGYHCTACGNNGPVIPQQEPRDSDDAVAGV